MCIDLLLGLLPLRCSRLLPPEDTIRGLAITETEFLGLVVAEDDVVMVDGDECVLWKRDVNDDLNDVGLVLLEDSDDALDISGQEICRFLLFLPERRE